MNSPASKKQKTELSKDEQIEQLKAMVAQKDAQLERTIAEKDALLLEKQRVFQGSLELLSHFKVYFGRVAASDVPKELWDNKDFVVLSIKTKLLRYWKWVPEALKQDRDICLLAYSFRLIEWKTIKNERKNDTDFAVMALNKGDIKLDDAPCLSRNVLRAALASGNLEWTALPHSLRCNPEFGRNVCAFREFPGKYNSQPLAKHVLVDCPVLRNENNVWKAIFSSSDLKNILCLFFKGLVPVRVLEDKELMVLACKKNAAILSHVGFSIQSDFDFVNAVLENNAVALAYITDDFFQRFSNCVISQMGRFCQAAAQADNEQACNVFAERLGVHLSIQPGLLEAWLDAGLPLLQSKWFDPWRNDRQKLLKIAKLCPRDNWIRNSFRTASRDLLDDADFIRQAMQLCPSVFECASHRIRYEKFDIAMHAFSSRNFVWRCREHGLGNRVDLRAHYKKAVESCSRYNQFVNPFLCILKYSETMQGLNQDSLIRLIGDFLDVPRGKHLCDIQRAVENFCFVRESFVDGGGSPLPWDVPRDAYYSPPEYSPFSPEYSPTSPDYTPWDRP